MRKSTYNTGIIGNNSEKIGPSAHTLAEVAAFIKERLGASDGQLPPELTSRQNEVRRQLPVGTTPVADEDISARVTRRSEMTVEERRAEDERDEREGERRLAAHMITWDSQRLDARLTAQSSAAVAKSMERAQRVARPRSSTVFEEARQKREWMKADVQGKADSKKRARATPDSELDARLAELRAEHGRLQEAIASGNWSTSLDNSY
ncbi:hypothetical protein KBD59_05230 [Candidatus Gracilibacteria bacterium]|nr:hypothetical protein [Candidatus Gracilibacteria bacterium]